MPANPWAVPAGNYTRPDGNIVCINKPEWFQKTTAWADPSTEAVVGVGETGDEGSGEA